MGRAGAVLPTRDHALHSPYASLHSTAKTAFCLLAYITAAGLVGWATDSKPWRALLAEGGTCATGTRGLAEAACHTPRSCGVGNAIGEKGVPKPAICGGPATRQAHTP